MTKALHLICHREGNTLHGLSRWDGDPNGYRSCCWLISDEDAAQLVGGWIYFHESKSSLSSFGGQILGFQPGANENEDMTARKIILFRADRSGRGQSWRGRDYGMAWGSGVVDADLEHEA